MAAFDIHRSIVERIESQEMPSYIYTYPPKSFYKPFHDWTKAAKSWENVEGPISLYIHIPFCNMKCSFCNLFTVTNASDNIKERYVSAILQELQIMKPFLDFEKLSVKSLYFGGGTPSLLTQGQISGLVSAIHTSFKVDPEAEISIEGTPDSFDSKKFKELISLGFNRVSMGVQTLNPDHLKKMGRYYPCEQAKKAGEEAVASGIKNVNMDFIYGIPGQTLDQWKEDLEEVLRIGPTTLTAYPLVVRQKTVYGRQKLKGIQADFADDKIKYNWYDFTYDLLTRNTFRQNTFVSFSKEKGGCLHEENEFKGNPTLSFGAGARKYTPNVHYVDEDYVQRLPTNTTMLEYMDAVQNGRLLVKSAAHLNMNEQILRFVILGLLAEGIDQDQFYARFKELLQDRFGSFFDVLVNEKMLNKVGQRWTLTPLGKKYSSIIGNVLSSEEAVQSTGRYG